jgi:hypothetical protein
MANLIDNPAGEWINNEVYELQATDPVQGAGIGGAFGGIGYDNQPHQQLANRTAFLNNKRIADEANIALLLARNTWTNIQAFNTPGTYTFAIPTAFVRIKVVGGGGGACGSLYAYNTGPYISGAGGGAGAYVEGIWAIPPGSVLTIKVAQGGPGGSGSGNGTNGGTSWVKLAAHLMAQATGGQAAGYTPGFGGDVCAGGLGGTGTTDGLGSGGAALTFGGGQGSDGQALFVTSQEVFLLGNGAAGPWGGAGRAANVAIPPYQDGAAPGAGGGGGYGGNNYGGKGANGIVILEW